MALGGTSRAPAMGVGGIIRCRADESFHGYLEFLTNTPFVPRGPATQRISVHAPSDEPRNSRKKPISIILGSADVTPSMSRG